VEIFGSVFAGETVPNATTPPTIPAAESTTAKPSVALVKLRMGSLAVTNKRDITLADGKVINTAPIEKAVN